MTESRRHLAWLGALVLALSAFTPAPARAQASQAAAAEALFRDGKELYAAKHYAEACPKLQESYRLDPGTGTLLLLASCHESEGRTASAWSEFTDAEARARREGRADRVQVASEHAAALLPRLARLTIRVARGAVTSPGFEVKLDGAAMGAPTWGTALPIDRGGHEVTATATGQQPWTQEVTIETDSSSHTVEVPTLGAAPVAGAPLAASAPADAPATAPQPDRSPPRTLAWVAGGVGVAAVGVGGWVALAGASKARSARDKANAATTTADYDAALPDYDSGKSQVRTGGIFLGVGAALVVTGIVLVATTPPRSTSAATRLAPWVDLHGGGLSASAAW